MLVVAKEAAAAGQPSERSFHNPSLREDDEALGRIGPLDDRKLPLADLADGFGGRLTLIRSIGKDDLNEGKQSTGPFIQEQEGAFPILNVRRMDHHIQHQSEGIDEDMVLDPLDFLSGVVTDRVRLSPPFSADRTD